MLSVTFSHGCTVPISPNERFLGLMIGFGACGTLFDVSLSLAWLTNAPMPQPLTVWLCSKSKRRIYHFRMVKNNLSKI